jgi:hypothetical protein
MASGMPSTPGLIGRMLGVLGSKVGAQDTGSGPGDRIARLGLSQRAQALNRLWAWYRTSQYGGRSIDWGGRQVMDPLAMEAVSSRGFIPPGFVDASGQNVPLKFRKPSVSYALAKVIVDRFTGLLFSENQHPQLHVDGDPETEDFLRAIVDVARLWQQMALARTYGGACGSVAIGFQFVEGKPVVEVHDPRWCEPDFIDRSTFVLRSIEKRYQYPKEERDPVTGRFETKSYWYRRVIDTTQDIVFKPVEVGNGEEPEWEVEKAVEHGLGFCPVVWVQNIPVQDDTDGDPDCHGAYEMLEAIDQLLSQAHRGLIANADPTLVISSESELGPSLQKGSDNAILIPKGDAKYLELTASGPKACVDMVDDLRALVLEVTQCFLESGPVQHNRTATEVQHDAASMINRGDVLREQYGERAVKPLLEMMFKAAVKLNQPRAMPVAEPVDPELQNPNDGQLSINDGPQMVRAQLNLPPRYEEDGTGARVAVPRTPGQGGVIGLAWPDYFRPVLADVLQASQAATTAVTGGVIDSVTAGKFIARYFDVENPSKMIEAAKAEFQQRQDQLTAGSLSTPGAAFP